MIIEFPGSLPLPVARALADDKIPSALRDALRTLATAPEDSRPDALDVVRDAIDGDEAGPKGLRLFPALVALAATREGFERTALVGSAGSLELVRLAVDVEIPAGLEEAWEEARLLALKLLAPLLGEPMDPVLIAPLLAAIAALHGEGDLAGLIASSDDLLGAMDGEEGDDNGDDGDNDEASDGDDDDDR